MSNLVREDINGGEASRRVGPAEQVGRPELGNHTRVGRQANATHRRQAHRHAIPTTTFLRVEVQPGIWEEPALSLDVTFKYNSNNSNGIWQVSAC